MNRYVLGLVALNEVLRFSFRGVMDVAFEFHIRNSFLDDDAADTARLRVPCNVVSAFERLWHSTWEYFD